MSTPSASLEPAAQPAEKRPTRPDYASMSDEDVAVLAQEGDEDATEYLLRKYEKLVYIWTRPYFLQGAEDDDLLQEGMIGLFKAIRDFNPGASSFWSFAKLCITRNIISAIKGTTRQKHIPLNSYTSLHKPIYDLEGDRTLMEVLISDQAQDPETLVINRERLIYAQRHIKETLSDFEYRVFRLYINGLSYKEMAERLNTHTKSIDNALCRIKNKIDTHF
ncbi:RNA polymerase sporulation sigma factor SigH [Limnochorda sp.]|uniref:RNA polymerase sporulation sigma factor SigH n=1 Tax=Limnochorda sp. TaxID=1940279 RepID=UPI001804DDAD|nr:RNA polymerase sporulation sigma factor SigH [Bacillota bacterium]NMA71911.1 RNA polymerase sporulation sigma factor SigH [Bacillota bacterium]